MFDEKEYAPLPVHMIEKNLCGMAQLYVSGKICFADFKKRI